jgi:archaellum biogenesis protein FlaJ (TadC family)
MEKIHHVLALFQEHKTVISWLALSSMVMFVGTLIAVPLMIVRIPVDYFCHEKRPPSAWLKYHPLAVFAILALRSLIGIGFILAGIAMLIIPGQGLLTIFIGLSLMTFPGKFAFERWMVTRPPIEKAINWIRKKSGHEPLRHPERCSSPSEKEK